MPTETDRQEGEESAGVAVKVSFRIMSPDLDPSEISLALEMQPTKAHSRGDANFGKSGRQYSDYSEGLWSWRPPLKSSDPLSKHLSAAINVLEPKAMALQRLKEMGLRLDLFVGIFGTEGNLEILLEHDLLRRLGALGLDLGFDIYPG